MDEDWESLVDDENIKSLGIPDDINRWEGEDEEDYVKENWEDEEEKKDEEKVRQNPPTVVEKTRKGFKATSNEKERKSLERERPTIVELTPEEKLAEKMRQLQFEKESDLKNALDTFGVNEQLNSLDTFNPTNKSEFMEFSNALCTKITQYKNDEEFPGFIEDLFRNICAKLSAPEIKKIKLTVDNLHIEAQKLGKATKKPPSKTKNKIKLRVESENIRTSNANNYGEPYDDYDDFM